MTQWIAETLVKHSEAYKKLEEAIDAVTTAQLKMQKVLYLNTESIKLNDQNDKYSGITIKTPDDVRDMIAGSIIIIGGVEWMLRNDGWVSGYGGERTHEEMFVSILLHLNHVFLLHKGY